jgi:hypothetical protein
VTQLVEAIQFQIRVVTSDVAAIGVDEGDAEQAQQTRKQVVAITTARNTARVR